MDLSIITVTWNSIDHIGEQMRSVMRGAMGISYEHIIVDNASTDGTADLVAREFPQCTLIRQIKNIGFARGNNTAFLTAKGNFLLFLNPDMRVEEGSLRTIVTYLRQHESIGIATCRLNREDGSYNWDASPRRFPQLRDQIALLLKLPHVFPQLLHRYLQHDLDIYTEQSVDSVRGAFMLVRRKVVEQLGFVFDPRYHMWFEDVDTCREAKQLGWDVVYTPIISCVDYVGQSAKKQPDLWRQQEFTRSMCTYFKKWEPWYVWMWIALLRPVGIFLVWMRSVMFHENKKTIKQ